MLNESANEITGNVKSDIHQLVRFFSMLTLILNNDTYIFFSLQGLLILSLATGQQIDDYHPQIPPDLHPTFKNFISALVIF